MRQFVSRSRRPPPRFAKDESLQMSYSYGGMSPCSLDQPNGCSRLYADAARQQAARFQHLITRARRAMTSRFNVVAFAVSAKRRKSGSALRA